MNASILIAAKNLLTKSRSDIDIRMTKMSVILPNLSAALIGLKIIK